jgi:hypothetical protein
MIRKILPLHSLLTAICLCLGNVVWCAPVQTEERILPGLFQTDSGSRPSAEADGNGGKTIAPPAGGLSGLRRRPLPLTDTLEQISVEVKGITDKTLLNRQSSAYQVIAAASKRNSSFRTKMW